MFLIVFSDIDGTLIDLTTFEMAPAMEGVNFLKENGIPLILCSAKTRAEQEKIRERMGIRDPFIVENGGAIYIPRGYFPSFPKKETLSLLRREKINLLSQGDYEVIALGREYYYLRRILEEIRQKTSLPLKGFGDMTAEEISRLTGLNIEEAEYARERGFDETLILTPSQAKLLSREVKSYGLTLTHGGRFYHLFGGSSKGRCVSLLSKIFKGEMECPLITMGIGDSLNDLPMLKVVDIPVLVEKKSGGWIDAHIKGLHRIKGIGPYGFSRAIHHLIKEKFPQFHH